jgi:hypothetical protein
MARYLTQVKRDFAVEAAKFTGAALEYEMGGSHYKVRITINDQRRYVVFPASPSDPRSHKNNLAFFRRTLKELSQK